MAKPELTIIGLGNVGTAFLHIIHDNGDKVKSVFSRRPVDTAFKKQYSDTFFGEGILNEKHLGELIFIAVSDDAIPEIVRQLSDSVPTFENKNVIHFSGTLSSEVLSPLKQKGALTASFHPIKSITADTRDFKNIWFDMDGDEKLLSELEMMAKDFGAKTFRVKPDDKTLLHASAVIASNYLVVLADLMTQITNEVGISEENALEAFTPLMKGTISNLENMGVAHSLTGPIARGDVQTIQQHLQSLEKLPELRSLYKKLGQNAVEIAKRRNGDTEALLQIQKMFT